MNEKDRSFVNGIEASIGGYSQYGPDVVVKLLKIIERLDSVPSCPPTLNKNHTVTRFARINHNDFVPVPVDLPVDYDPL